MTDTEFISLLREISNTEPPDAVLYLLDYVQSNKDKKVFLGWIQAVKDRSAKNLKKAMELLSELKIAEDRANATYDHNAAEYLQQDFWYRLDKIIKPLVKTQVNKKNDTCEISKCEGFESIRCDDKAYIVIAYIPKQLQSQVREYMSRLPLEKTLQLCEECADIAIENTLYSYVRKYLPIDEDIS